MFLVIEYSHLTLLTYSHSLSPGLSTPLFLSSLFIGALPDTLCPLPCSVVLLTIPLYPVNLSHTLPLLSHFLFSLRLSLPLPPLRGSLAAIVLLNSIDVGLETVHTDGLQDWDAVKVRRHGTILPCSNMFSI
jgi:hypothetical protein